MALVCLNAHRLGNDRLRRLKRNPAKWIPVRRRIAQHVKESGSDPTDQTPVASLAALKAP
jgi:hypothetical protein